ncbi:MAG: hypothetical protein OXF41_12650 [bacterium]|nr:hypothetical protein [bacterium]
MKEPPLRTPVRWGPVGLGTVSGLLVMAVAGFAGTTVLSLLGQLGVATGETADWAVLSLSLIGGELVGGYVAGRLAGKPMPGLPGSLASLGLYAVVASLSLVRGSPAGILTLVVFALAAAAIGYAGGALGGS